MRHRRRPGQRRAGRRRAARRSPRPFRGRRVRLPTGCPATRWLTSPRTSHCEHGVPARQRSAGKAATTRPVASSARVCQTATVVMSTILKAGLPELRTGCRRSGWSGVSVARRNRVEPAGQGPRRAAVPRRAGAQGGLALLGERGRGAEHRRTSVEDPADWVEVVLDPVPSVWLDQQERAVAAQAPGGHWDAAATGSPMSCSESKKPTRS